MGQPRLTKPFSVQTGQQPHVADQESTNQRRGRLFAVLYKSFRYSIADCVADSKQRIAGRSQRDHPAGGDPAGVCVSPGIAR